MLVTNCCVFMSIMHNYVGLELIMLTGTISHRVTRQKHIYILDNGIPPDNQQNISYLHDCCSIPCSGPKDVSRPGLGSVSGLGPSLNSAG